MHVRSSITVDDIFLFRLRMWEADVSELIFFVPVLYFVSWLYVTNYSDVYISTHASLLYMKEDRT